MTWALSRHVQAGPFTNQLYTAPDTIRQVMRHNTEGC
jgi:hypothetical protein